MRRTLMATLIVLAVPGTACSRDVLHTGAAGTTVAPSRPVPIHPSVGGGCDAGVDTCSAQGTAPGETCDPGLTACPGPGAGYCFDLQTSPEHCGTCDHACVLGSPCENGQCRVVHCTSQVSARNLPVEGLPFGGRGLVPTDCDRDGNLDLLAFGPGASPTQPLSMGVVRGNGDGTFVTGERYLLDTPFWSPGIQVADLNRDQIADLIIMIGTSDATTPASAPRFRVVVRLGNGACSFGPEIALDAGTEVISLAIGDLDGDQIPDLVVSASERISTFHGNGNGSFSNRRDFAVGGSPGQMAATDWNSDGIPDVVATDNYLHLLLGAGDGNFAPAIDCALKVSSLVIGDFDKDGVVDLASGSAVWFGMHECSIARQVIYSAKPYSFPLAAGDFNGDGTLDLVLRYDEGIGFVAGDGHGSFGDVVRLGDLGSDYPYVWAGYVGDFNGDGRLDLIETNNVGSRTFINTCQ